MKLTQKLTACMCAAMIAATMMAPAANACTIPYIDDVNDWGARSSIVTVCALKHDGDKAVKWKVTDAKTKKAAKVENVHRYKNWYVCMVVMKHGRTYKVSVKAKANGKWSKWKSIGYCVY